MSCLFGLFFVLSVCVVSALMLIYGLLWLLDKWLGLFTGRH
jgi:hypothetical protein